MMSKKRTKFLPLSGNSESNFVMPGRQKCDCAATKHDLINNCIDCGRIICVQEGSGPCWFCGALVCTEKENTFIRSNSNNALCTLDKLKNKIWSHQKDLVVNHFSTNDDDKTTDAKEAQERKERLLEFDRNSTRRTKVIDDQSDYYRTEGTSWIDPKKRELLKKKEDILRAERFAPAHTKPLKYTLDLTSGSLSKESQSNTAAFELFEDPDLPQFEEFSNDVQKETSVNAEFLTYVGSHKPKKTGPLVSDTRDKQKILNRIQDKELQDIRDDGMCLSMHQPWASLLVCGVKRDEGRSWFSNHRGRLWIAATVKEPSPDSVEEMKQFYLNRGIDREMFPDSYPVGCILGCVDIVDCLPADDYRDMYPDGESDSPFVFICENPKELSLKFPIKGKHKIYKLESHIHNAAKGAIQRDL